jgi:hypothetical protein
MTISNNFSTLETPGGELELFMQFINFQNMNEFIMHRDVKLQLCNDFTRHKGNAAHLVTR